MDPLVAAMILQGFRFGTDYAGTLRLFHPNGSTLYRTRSGWQFGVTIDRLIAQQISDWPWADFPRITNQDYLVLTTFM